MLISENEVSDIGQRINLAKFKNEKILITGGTGMVGSYLLETLLKVGRLQDFKPKEIKVLSFRGNYSSVNHLMSFENVKFETFNLQSPHQINGYDYVIHAASPASPKQFLPLNEMDEINSGVLDYIISNDTKDLLYISSGEVYGIKHNQPILENEVSGAKYDELRSSYPISKLKAEEKCKYLFDKDGVSYKIARLFHTFGPGLRENDGRSFADFLWSAARGARPILNSDGKDVRTFLYTLDSVVGLILLFTCNEKFKTINVGSAVPFSIFEFANRISCLAGLGQLYGIEQNNLKVSNSKIIIPDIGNLLALGWRQLYDLDKTIDMTLHWIKKTNGFS
jgi:nucleoside-diphosphate-sugar epimerase